MWNCESSLYKSVVLECGYQFTLMRGHNTANNITLQHVGGWGGALKLRHHTEQLSRDKIPRARFSSYHWSRFADFWSYLQKFSRTKLFGNNTNLVDMAKFMIWPNL